MFNLQQACAFMQELSEQNDRTWFSANRKRYESLVAAPLCELVGALAPAMLAIDPGFDVRPAPGGAVSRPFRSMRFKREGQGPLHEAAWLVFRNRSAAETLPPAFFFEIAPGRCRFGMGFYSLPPWRMDQVRAAIDRNVLAFASLVRALPPVEVCGDTYKRPMGDHLPPDLRTWYGRKCIHVQVVPDLHTPDIARQVQECFVALGPLYRFWRDSYRRTAEVGL